MSQKKCPCVLTPCAYSSLLASHPGWLGQQGFPAKLPPPPPDCAPWVPEAFPELTGYHYVRSSRDSHSEAESERVCWLQGPAGSEEDRGREDAGADDRGHPGGRAVPHAGLHPVLQLPAQRSRSLTAEDRRGHRLQRIFKGNAILGTMTCQPVLRRRGNHSHGGGVYPHVSQGDTNIAKNVLVASCSLSS